VSALFEPSLDAFSKITPSMTAALTLNADFAGTTADARQINLMRFDLIFPEQRAFFLQDSDIFEFGRIENEDGRPFFAPRIGIDDDGETLTLDGGLKLAGCAEAGFKTLEENYFPALGFASRTDIVDIEGEPGYTWRPSNSWARSVYSGVDSRFVNAINGRDRSKEIEFNVIEVENQTAERFELEHSFVEKRLTECFEISDGIVIPAGTYSFDYDCASVYTGEQRVLAANSTIYSGDFYDGDILVVESKITWRPSAHLKVTLGGEYDNIDLPQGDFITRLLMLNADIAFNVAWSWEKFLQYDNVSDTISINSILRWIPRAGREMVLAINSQLEDFDRDRNFQSYTSDLTLKLNYTFRF
jgi:hypothetical protein